MLKKQLFMALVAVMITLSFSGCNQKEEVKELKKEEQEIDEEAELKSEVYLGRVKSIVGNEIELELGKDIALEEVEEEEKETTQGEKIPSVLTQPAMSSESEEGGQVPGGAVEHKLELEYTGEEKSFIIPTGASIHGPFGDNGKVTDVKEGAIIQVIGFVEEEQLKIVQITILS